MEENNYPLGFLHYIVLFLVDHLLPKFQSKAIRQFKQEIKNLEETQSYLTKSQEDNLKFIRLLQEDNKTLKIQLAEKNDMIRKLEDYLLHISAYAMETKQKTTMQPNVSCQPPSNYFDVYQDILGALTFIRHGTNLGKTLKRRDSRKNLTERSNYKKMYYELACSNNTLNLELEQKEDKLTKARNQVEILKQDQFAVQKIISQKNSHNDVRICQQLNNWAEQMEQYRNLLASYQFLETQYINLKNDHEIIVSYADQLQVILEDKNVYITSIQKVVTSFLALKYLFHEASSNYDHDKFVEHLAENGDPKTRSNYFQSFVDSIRKAIVQERESKIYQIDDESIMLKLTALQNKCENIQCLREDAESKCDTLREELNLKEKAEVNLLEEYNKICLMHTNVTAEVRQKTRELENLNKNLQMFKDQARENEEDLKKGQDQIKQSYHVIENENTLLKSQKEVAENRLHDLLVEKGDLLDKYNCLEQELDCAQNQLNQYKNPALMPSYQEVFELYNEIKRIVDEAEHRERVCAERNNVLTEQINDLTSKNYQLKKSGPVSEKICKLYEAVGVIKDQQLLQDSERTEMKQVVQPYRKEMHHLDLENLKLLSSLKDEKTSQKHRKFKHKFEKVKAEIKTIENSFEPDKLDQIVLNFEDNLNTLTGETLEVVGKMSPENASPAQLARKYEELVEILKMENARLWDCLNNKSQVPKEINRYGDDIEEDEISSDSPYVNLTLEKIRKIRQNIAQLEKRVDNFLGSKTDKEYLDLEHKLLESIMQIDVIQVEGHEIIREKRKQTIIYANNCMKKLGDNVIE